MIQYVLSEEDILRLSDSARDEVIQLVMAPFQKAGTRLSPETQDPRFKGLDMRNVVDLSVGKVRLWMDGLSDITRHGMLVFAVHGPVIEASKLRAAGIANVGQFHSRVTMRTRTILGEGAPKDAVLLAVDDHREAAPGGGRYAVSLGTYEALREYFGLDSEDGAPLGKAGEHSTTDLPPEPNGTLESILQKELEPFLRFKEENPDALLTRTKIAELWGLTPDTVMMRFKKYRGPFTLDNQTRSKQYAIDDVITFVRDYR